MHSPSEAAINQAKQFLAHYHRPEMQNYGRWVYVIRKIMLILLQESLNIYRYEDFINCNNIINTFLQNNKLFFLERNIFDYTRFFEDDVPDTSVLKDFLQKIRFLDFINAIFSNSTAIENMEELICTQFFSIISLIRRTDFNSYALSADLGLIDVASTVLSNTDSLIPTTWHIDRIAELDIYAARGPKMFPPSCGALGNNAKFWSGLLDRNITTIVALGVPGEDFYNYLIPAIYTDIDEHGNKFTISSQPEGFNDSNANGINTAYLSFQISIIYTCGTVVIKKNITVHNIQVPDATPFHLEPQTVADIINALNSTLDLGSGAIVHCHAGHGRTGHFLTLYLLERLNQLETIFSSNDIDKNIIEYRNFIKYLRTFRERLLATPQQIFAALEQYINFSEAKIQTSKQVSASIQEMATTDLGLPVEGINELLRILGLFAQQTSVAKETTISELRLFFGCIS